MAISKTDPRGVPVQRDARSEVQRLFDDLGRALTSGDGEAVAAIYDVPALIISDEGVIAVNTTPQIAKFFSDAHARSNANGVVETRADLQDLERIGERMVIATVRWPHLDADHREVASESSDYTLRRDDEGRLRIRSVLMRGMAAQPR